MSKTPPKTVVIAELADALHSIVGQIVQGRHGPTVLQLLRAISALETAAKHGSDIPKERCRELQTLVERQAGVTRSDE